MVDAPVNESFWSKLVAGESSFRLPRALLFLIFFGGAVFFGWSFRRVVELSAEEPVFVPPPPRQSQEDAKRLDGLIESYRATVEARQRSKDVAGTITGESRRPFVVSSREAAAAAAASAAVSGAGGVYVDPLVSDMLPPIMFVRAIMVVGREAVAVMDINGVGNGIIVKSGYSFLNKQGRVLGISPEKVTVRWAGKNIEITPGF